MITGIVAALPEEANTLSTRKIAQGKCIFIADQILLIRSGVGPVNAGNAVKLLLENGAQAIISWGCAAALAQSLKPGDLTLPQDLVTGDQQRLSIDSKWHRHALALLSPQVNIHTGSLAETHHIISTRHEKQAMHELTGAIALDMESAAVAKTAAEAGVPCLVIRTIADPADMDLPAAVSYAMNASGTVEIKKLFRFLAIHPGQLPALGKLALSFHAAARTLKSIAAQLPALTIDNALQPSTTKQ